MSVSVRAVTLCVLLEDVRRVRDGVAADVLGVHRIGTGVSVVWISKQDGNNNNVVT